MSEGLYERARFRTAGDRGLLVEYGDAIDPVINRKVRAMAIALGKEPPEGVLEVIPTYRSLLILYDPLLTTSSRLEKDLLALEERLPEIQIPPPEIVEIPVCYGGEYGPDLESVAQSHGLSPEEVIRNHSEPLSLIHISEPTRRS